MFRQQVSPKTAAIATLIVLALIQGVYWRLLVYTPGSNVMPAGGGGAGAAQRIAFGREDVLTEGIIGGGPGYRDGPMWSAQFNGPNGVAAAPDGSVFISDSRNHRIRRLDVSGEVTTVAGVGEPDEEAGNLEGSALEARLNYPSGVAVGAGGEVYIADTGNHRICLLRDGKLTTLAGKVEGRADGVGTAAAFRYPSVLLWQGGALWAADLGNAAIRRIEPSGKVTTPQPAPAAVRAVLGDLGVSSAGQPLQASVEGRGPFETVEFVSGRRSPGVAIAANSWLFCDPENHVVLAQRGSSTPMLIAGRRGSDGPLQGSGDGPGQRSSFMMPCAATISGDRVVYLAEYEGNRIRRLRLPDWMLTEQEPPAMVRRRWRSSRGG